MSLRHLQYETGSRVRKALSQVEQANAVLEFIVTVFQHFPGFDDPEPYYHLQALVNRTGLVFLTDHDTDSVGTAIRLISDRRLPELLAVPLVSAVETCLTDIAEIEVSARQRLTKERASRVASKLMRGGPRDYLPRLASLFDLRFLLDQPWQQFRELVATRNLLVHSYAGYVDDKYLQQAGPHARLAVGDRVNVDSHYLLAQYRHLRFLLQHFLLEHPRRDA